MKLKNYKFEQTLSNDRKCQIYKTTNMFLRLLSQKEPNPKIIFVVALTSIYSLSPIFMFFFFSKVPFEIPGLGGSCCQLTAIVSCCDQYSPLLIKDIKDCGCTTVYTAVSNGYCLDISNIKNNLLIGLSQYNFITHISSKITSY